MPPNWDDEFDFDDLQAKPAPKKQKEQKKPKKDEDDFFDLDDVPPAKDGKLPAIGKKTTQQPAPPPSKQKDNKKSKNNYNDYQEIYEQVEEIKSPKNNSPSKKIESSNYYEELEEIEEIKPKVDKKDAPKQQPIIAKRQQQEEEFYQSLQDIKSPPKEQKKTIEETKKEAPKPQPKQVQKDEDIYEEQNFDQYGEDFEEPVEEKVPPKETSLNKKSHTSVNLKSKDKNINEPAKKVEEKKYPISTNKVFTNKEQKDPTPSQPVIPKPPQKENAARLPSASSKKATEPASRKGVQTRPANIASQQKTLQKSVSKKSLQSNDSKKYIGNSRVTKKNSTQFIPNKHILLVDKQFPDSEQKIGQMTHQKLGRVNEQIRDMIRKFNEQLNELINKNMILLKQKPAQRHVDSDAKVKILEEQLKSGATALQTVENELDRLKGRQGELRQEEYQLIIEKKIEQTKENLKEITKMITKLKVGVNSQGNKLSKQDVQKKISQDLHQIKVMLIQVKKQEEKNEVRLEKLQKMAQQLESKNADKQYELTEQIDNAKQKGVVLGIKQQTKKRFQQLKMKIASFENHRRCMQGLTKSKCEALSHENDQIKITIKSIESQINNLNQSTEHAQDESVKLIKKAKENPKISAILSENLDKIMKSIEDSQNINFYEIRTEGNKSQASQRPLKTSMYDNISKEKPSRNSSSKKQPVYKSKIAEEPAPNPDEINMMKPNFMKKKEKVPDSASKQEEKKHQQRIWNEEQEKKKQLEEKKRQQQEKKKEVIPPPPVEEDKKKPFSIKKNRGNSGNTNETKSLEQTPEEAPKVPSSPLHIPQKLEIKEKEEDKPALGPKFMKFNRKDKNADVIKNDISQQKPIQEEKKKPLEQPPKIDIKLQEEQQPSFVPKRFNLRTKIQKKEENYVPTIEKDKKQQPKIKQQIKIKEEPKIKDQPKIKQEKKQYTPNFSFKDQEIKPSKDIQGKKIENDVKLDIPEQKPKFNLRLRDRQKKETTENNDYIPSRLTQVTEDKMAPKNNGGYNPFNKDLSIKQEKPAPLPAKKEEENTYMPSLRRNNMQNIQPEKDKQVIKEPSTNPYAPKEPVNNSLKEPANNPYAPKQPANNPYAPKQPVSNPYAPKEPANNPYAPKQPANNPYAPKPAPSNPYAPAPAPKQEQAAPSNPYAVKEDANKPQREGPVKKIKIQNKGPKQKFNIYDQAEDITEAVSQPINQPPKQPAFNPLKTEDIDLNAMLGIQKKKQSDLDDLLGDIKIDKKKDKKKNNDFFNDLQI